MHSFTQQPSKDVALVVLVTVGVLNELLYSVLIAILSFCTFLKSIHNTNCDFVRLVLMAKGIFKRSSGV